MIFFELLKSLKFNRSAHPSPLPSIFTQKEIGYLLKSIPKSSNLQLVEVTWLRSR